MIDADVAKAWGLLLETSVEPCVVHVEEPEKCSTWLDGNGKDVPDPTDQPQAWLSAFLAKGHAIHIRACGDGHLHFHIDSSEWVEYLGWENLGPATEAAIRAWAKVAVR